MMKRLVQSGKIYIKIKQNLNAVTINLTKQFIACLGKTQVTGEKNALPSPPENLQTFWPAAPLCPLAIVIWIGQYILFMRVCMSPNHFTMDWKIAFIYGNCAFPDP